jgi:hypothetical protein
MQTPIIVRAIASGGKFIGDLVGGFSVTVNIPGQTPVTVQSSGSSGNTVDLMQMQRLRTDPLPTNSDTVEMPGSPAASAQTTVDISSPVMATISVVGPGNFQGQQSTVTKTAWLLPGLGLTGDPKYTNGLLMELPGLLIQNATAQPANGMLSISAQVTMMCGCKIIDNNGIWVSTDFTVTAQQLDANGNELSATPMTYVPYTSSTSTPSLFKAAVVSAKGVKSVRILASQRSMGNGGSVVVGV